MSRPRKPARATKGFRDRMVRELQAKGYQYATARRAVREIFDQMKQALAEGEAVEVPGLGRLVVSPAKQKRCLRLGKIVDIPQYPFRIELLKKLPGERRRRPAKKNVSQKLSVSSQVSHPPRIAVQPHRKRPVVPSRTRKMKPGKR